MRESSRCGGLERTRGARLPGTSTNGFAHEAPPFRKGVGVRGLRRRTGRPRGGAHEVPPGARAHAPPALALESTWYKAPSEAAGARARALRKGTP